MPDARGFDYKRYLASREWATLREAVRKRAGNACERCDILPMQVVHHLTYERIGHERLEDLQAICKPCHEYESGKCPYDPIDIRDWAFNSGFDQAEMENMWGKGWKDSHEAAWRNKYGFDWELWFIRFAVLNPTITNLDLETDWAEI